MSDTRVRKQKTDHQDAQLILRLMMEDRFPRIWVPSWENRDLRQLPWHRDSMVQARTRIMNQLQAVALNEGLRCKKRLWREAVPLGIDSRQPHQGPGIQTIVFLPTFPDQPHVARLRHDTPCLNSLNNRLAQGECIPVSNAIRLRGMPPNTERACSSVSVGRLRGDHDLRLLPPIFRQTP
jgi:hypothetical protein